ncbi:YhgE/Pip domain-containing protein [Streptomyces sp. NBC_00102]|uniref:YhgE/Pip domain-containing protein n=1 Tax=Streptomyces sp. NBC_00102 TaxID=2975652 RepID=UPI002253734B|nr:YhgE/Pip domain-containing protein [Streptomyces sp. NBC_00102]MCX5396509.1 YhgE/Pip domain-containing protein [Streptomyces sp. NBC_00102]
MRATGLAGLELKRFGRGKLPRAALAALLLLPLLYGALYLWSFWDPYGHLDRIPVALVDEDEGARIPEGAGGKDGGGAAGDRLAVGDELTEKLLDSKTFAWHRVGAAEARRGVEDGTYYLSLTLPADLSRRIASSAGDSPATGTLQVRTNDANNYIVGQISRTVFSEIRAAASTEASRGFLDRIFVDFSDLHDATAKAASGADDLRNGIATAEQGSKDLAEGLGESKAGSERLSDGITALDQGSADLRTGSRQVADATQLLADQVDGIAAQVRPFLEDGGTSIGDTARLVADASRTVRENLGELVEAAPVAAAAAHTAADDLAAVHAQRCEDPPVPDAAVCDPLENAVEAAAGVARVADDVDALVEDEDGDLAALRTRLTVLQQRAEDLAEHAPTLGDDLESAVAKVDALNAGAQQVAEGAGTLRTGLSTARSGATALDSGVGELKTGADGLDSGLHRLSEGSTTLADGLNDGVDRIPDYDEADRDARTGVMADPVRLASSSLHAAPNYGTGFAPYFIPLSLWVGAMVAYMLTQPLNRRALAAGASARRTAFAGWLPVAAIGLLQVAALMSVLHWGLGLEMARPVATVGFLALVTCCFAAIVQWLNARFGAAGRILVLALLMLQLTSAGGTYPVRTSPGFFEAIHPWLPMSYVVDALRRLITGGGSGPVWLGCAVLAAFTAGALALTAVAARRKQVWTLERLHPELSL